MKTLFRCLTALLLLSEAPFVAQAEPFVITQGSFGIGRGLIGLDKGAAELLWFNPPPGAFESSERKRIDLLAASWSPDLYESTLLGGTTVVLPLHPGPVPVGGTFSGDKGASFFFQGDGPDVSPFLESSISLTLSGGTFLIPTEFPPTDDEGTLYPRATLPHDRHMDRQRTRRHAVSRRPRRKRPGLSHSGRRPTNREFDHLVGDIQL